MVWSTTQSALYNDLSRYYEDEKRPRNRDKFEPEKIEQIIEEKRPEKSNENCCENTDENPSKNREEICRKCDDFQSDAHCPHCPGNHCPGNQGCPRLPCVQNQQCDPITRLMSDKDMLLIAGLILLLIKQGADRKLILALAFVLLS